MCMSCIAEKLDPLGDIIDGILKDADFLIEEKIMRQQIEQAKKYYPQVFEGPETELEFVRACAIQIIAMRYLARRGFPVSTTALQFMWEDAVSKVAEKHKPIQDKNVERNLGLDTAELRRIIAAQTGMDPENIVFIDSNMPARDPDLDE